MPTVTVNGANGQTFPVAFTSNDSYSSAFTLAAAINAVVANPGVSTQVLTGAGSATAPGAGKIGQLVATNNTATPFQVEPGSDQIIVVNGTGRVSVGAGNGISNVSVIAGSGGLTFNAGMNSTTGANATGTVVVAGDGNNLLGTATGTGGSAFFQTGSGSDTITAVSGFNTVEAGTGGNLIATGSANDVIYTTGLDVVVGNTAGVGGSDTITTLGTGFDFVFGLGSNITFVNAGTAASTVIGGSASDTVFAGTGGGQFYAGTGGNSSLVGGSGLVTLVGGGNGDQLFSLYTPGSGSTVAGSAYLVAGTANETISAVSDSRGVQAFAGNNALVNGAAVTANTVIFGSSGNDTIYAGTGNATLNSGGGTDVFGFISGKAGGFDTISGFTSSDKIVLGSYTVAAGMSATQLGITANGVSAVSVSGGNTSITLSDNTKITITGFTSLTNSNFG